MGTILVDNEGIKGTISEKEENIRKFFIQLGKDNKFKGIEKKSLYESTALLQFIDI